MKLETAIKCKKCIDVDATILKERYYSGIGISLSESITVLINIYRNRLDGYTLIKTDDIKKYRIWDEEEVSKLKNLTVLKKYLGQIDLAKFQILEQCLEYLKSHIDLIAVWNNEEKAYYVGKLIRINKKTITLKLLSESAKWQNEKRISIDKILQISFGTSYERRLLKKFKE